MLPGCPAKDGSMQTCASVEGAPKALVKNSIDELRNACLPKALALPLIFRISARPIGSSPTEITSISGFLEEPETSMFGAPRHFGAAVPVWAIYIIDPGMKQRIVIPVNILIGQTTVRPYRLG